MFLTDIFVEWLPLTSVWFWVSVFIVYVVGNNYLMKEPWKRLPPGPPVVPMLGSLPFLGTDLREPFIRMTEKYGDVFTVYLGSQRAIVLGGYDVIKEAFVSRGNLFLGRPKNVYVDDVSKRIGVTSAEGARWRDQRRYVQQILHQLGFGRSIMEEKILDEARHYIQELRKHLDTPHFPQQLLQASSSNVINSVLLGKRREYDDPKLMDELECLDLTYKLVINTDILSMLPILRYLPGDIFGYHKLLMLCEKMDKEHQRAIDEYKASKGKDTSPSLVKEYLEKIAAESNNQDTFFTETQLKAIMRDLCLAGSETSSNTLTWAILFLSLNQDVQTRVQAEINDVLGEDEMPTMQHLSSMPYVNACICEIQRIADLLPYGFPHCPEEDVTFRGYDIPKGTMILPVMHNVHFDKKLWPQPDKFKPERFLNDDGTTKKPDEFIPFFLGKRDCFGKELGRMEVFLFFVMLLKNFQFRLAPGQAKPDTRGIVGVTNQPPYFKAIIESRN